MRTDDLVELKSDVKLILTNHLPHLQEKLVEHDQKLKLILYLLGAVAIGVLGALIKKAF